MATELQGKKLVVIDGKSVFYRGYYAMPNLSTKDGTPTGGVFGFATMALEVVKRLQPDYVAVAWDKPKTNIRRRLELYPEYKAGRKPAPPDFYAQVPVLHELLRAFDWPLYELDDYEADDIMGTLAVQAAEQGVETLLVTSDMDMLQLVNDRVKVYALKKGLSNIELYSPDSFSAKYGIDVHQFLDLKSIMGDSSDNIPGVPGIGQKGAVALLQEYKTLDGVYENLALIKESQAKKLQAGRDSAYLSRELAKIWTDAPLKFDPEATDGHACDPSELLALLQKLEFRSLARQLPEIMQVDPADQPMHGSVSLTLGDHTIVRTQQELAQVTLASEELYVFARSGGKHGKQPQLLILADKTKKTYSLDLTSLPADQVCALLQGKSIIGYDTKSVLQVLLELGCKTLPPVKHDVLIGAFALDALRREQSLTDLAAADLQYEGSSFESLDIDDLQTRAPEIIAVLAALSDHQQTALQLIPKLPELLTDIELPVIAVLARMEHAGIELDTQYMADFSKTIETSIREYEQQIYAHANKAFNIASPSQLAEVLFTNLELPTQGIKKGKTGYSTAASELDKLRGKHPIIDLITLYREVTKLKSTYVDTLPKQVDENSRVHTTFALTVAQTGRLSSNDPNLQNIPTRTELGRHIRTAFVAGKGNKLVSADYSQFELRLAAVLAEDTELIDLFNRGTDIHTMTAAQVYGRDPEDVSKQMRRAAKVINFGILYGMSPHGLSVATGMTIEQAGSFIKRYKEVRSPLFEYMNTVKEQARKDNFVATLFGRRRPMPDIHSSNFMVRSAAERAAINMPIQGTEADLMKMAMVAVDERLAAQHNNCRQLLQIHDSILVECPAAVAEDIGAMLKDVMEHIHDLPVRLDVDVTIGDNWGEL